MSVPLRQVFDVGSYIIKQKIAGNKYYPLVLMLEPLFRCNLACAGCGKIDYPDEILNKRLSVEECLEAVDECGAPVVSIPGGEPLLHKEMPQIVAGIIARKKYVYLCTNALLMEKKMDQYQPSPYFTWSVHLDGLKTEHDKSVCQDGVYDKAVSAIKKAIARGFRVNINCTLFNNAVPERVAAFFDSVMDMGINAITVSPGYAYERAPDQEHFLSRKATKELFRDVLRRGQQSEKQGKQKWRFSVSSNYVDFLAGNQEYHCTPWGLPTRNVFGWQRPCYLLGEGFAKTYKELLETTEWEKYGTGNYEKCANCMVHSGYEPTAAEAAMNHPVRSFMLSIRGPRTEGPMAPEIDLTKQRKAEWMFDKQVADAMGAIHADKMKREEKAAAPGTSKAFTHAAE
ncbi:MAG: adenosyl-hopene transferase HpnH [Alphaproteobacteria bacterium]|nr:adenosyl-hopene transferase HpnH [Alphaproteobacteria bacterium]